MTEFSPANDSSHFDGNTVLLECEHSEYVYTSGLENLKFKVDDKFIDYTSLMGNNMYVSLYFCDWKKIYIFHIIFITIFLKMIK